jgi:hypothetical protein
MTTSTAYSVRAMMLAVFVLGAISTSALAADGMNDLWLNNTQPCTSCGDSACSGCFDGIDVPYCGDMTPLAMCPGGQWYFQANAIAYQRSATQNDIFQTRNVNTFATEEVLTTAGDSLVPPLFALATTTSRDPVLSTDDLDFQFAAGYRLLMGWQLAEKYAIEFSYFDLNDWDETAVVSDATEHIPIATTTINTATGVITPGAAVSPSLFSPFSGFGNPPIAAFDYNDLASISYQSSLDNVELNVRHMVTKNPSRIAVSVLWGGRYNAVQEQFRYFTSSVAPAPGPGNNEVNLRTDNSLWGLQLGTQIDFCWDPGWHTEFEVKGGVAQNRAVLVGDYDIQGAPAGGYQGRVDKDVTSWIGEMRLTLVYQFGTHLTTHVGYEALVLSRVALASRNFETDLSILGSPGAESWVLDNGGSAVYHGPSAGLTFAW